jgi:copper transport protein
MAAVILDEPGDLFDSDWGRLFLTKTTAVAIAAGLGAFNHFRLRPALEQRPDDPALAKELRTSLVAESAVLVVVIVLTAWLVAAAT